jgi:hypothetical protein
VLRSAKKPRRDVGVRPIQTQTATPPPSARKGERKLAPKLKTGAMQNDQEFGQTDFTATPQQTDMAAFVASPSDMFSYPLSAPATAPANFWDPSGGLSGMDLDFAAAGNLFQTPTPGQRFEWAHDTQLFPSQVALPPQPQEKAQTPRRERPLAPKTSMPGAQTPVASGVNVSGSFSTMMEDPFGIVNPVGGVDPGLLFSRPQSSSMDTHSFNASNQIPMSAAVSSLETVQLVNAAHQGQVRRTSSVREMGSKPAERVIMSSPVKSSARPGLGRSFSENRGKKGLGRGMLPALVPAARPAIQQASGSGVGNGRPPSSRASGRVSPLKQHQRLSSIPETTGPRTRTEVKFTIDSRGRARAETTVVMEEPTPGSIHRRRPSRDLPRRGADWESSEEDSSTDDEPIIIPSRNTSFALPDPRKPTYHSSQRSISERSTTSTVGAFGGERIGSQHGDESEAETVLNDLQREKGGDAASELIRVKETRQKRSVSAQVSNGHRPQRFLSGSFGAYHGSAISPTTVTEASLPTPSSSASRNHGIRCVCNRNEADREGDGFMVQWWVAPNQKVPCF